MAMAHHKLGHHTEARGAYDQAVRWLEKQKGLPEQYAKELATFRGEAQSVLAGLAELLPAEVFASPK
jgi:hypothetical protein